MAALKPKIPNKRQLLSLTKPALIRKCKQYKLSTYGSKKDMIERIISIQQQQNKTKSLKKKSKPRSKSPRKHHKKLVPLSQSTTTPAISKSDPIASIIMRIPLSPQSSPIPAPIPIPINNHKSKKKKKKKKDKAKYESEWVNTDTLSSLSFNTIVTHYVDRHCNRSDIPQDILSLIVQYVSYDTSIKFTGQNLRDLLSWKQGEKRIKRVVKISRHLDCLIKIAPDGRDTISKGRVIAGICLSYLSKKIEHIMICVELSCVEAKSMLRFCRIFDHENKKNMRNGVFGTELSKLQNYKQMTYIFRLISLRIKYKEKNIKSSKSRQRKLAYYPSLNAIKLNQITNITWKSGPEMITKFKTCEHGQEFWSPVMDNWCIICCPDGLFRSRNSQNKFQFAIRCMSWPKDISKMEVSVDVKINQMDGYAATGRYVRIFTTAKMRDGSGIMAMKYNTFSRDLLCDDQELCFEFNIKIDKLWDLNNKEIPAIEWDNHHVIVDATEL